MFTDGVTLEVDVDEEWVEMVERDGSVFRSGLFLVVLTLMARLTDGGRIFSFRRYSVRECSTSRKVGDRMKIFQEFLPLFDD